MFECRRIEGLIAESLYEDLSESDQGLLDGHLSQCSACREELASLKSITEAIPRTRPRLDEDLAARVREELEGPQTRARGQFSWGVATLAASALLAVSLGMYLLRSQESSPRPADRASIESPVGPVARVLEQAQSMAKEFDYTGAYILLSKTLAEFPDEAPSGQVQERLADLAFSDLQWYREAHEAYHALRVNYYEEFQADPRNVFRMNVLDEAQGSRSDFAPLHALDASSLNGSFEGFERLLTEYPGSYIGSMAAHEMAWLEAGRQGLPETEESLALAMRSVIGRCTTAVSKAQVKIELGHVLGQGLGDYAGARKMYREVAAVAHPVLALQARESLHDLEGTPGPQN